MILQIGRKAVLSSLGLYEKTLKSIADVQQAVGEASQRQWFSAIAAAQADFTREMAALPQLVNGVLETTARAWAAMGKAPQFLEESRALVRETRALVEKVQESADLAWQKMGEVDMERALDRVDRAEQALLNIERATINLDRTLEGSIESLPNFLSRRARQEGQKIDPTRP